jgi:uncharacterized protein involved in outer membrane biogenesis
LLVAINLTQATVRFDFCHFDIPTQAANLHLAASSTQQAASSTQHAASSTQPAARRNEQESVTTDDA